MLNLALKPEYIFAPLLVIVFAITLFAFEPESGRLLAFSRSHIAGFEFWRLATGHLLHNNFNHLMLNTLGLILLWALHGHYYSFAHYLAFLVYSALFTSFSIYLFSPDLDWYVGLSGVLHGLFTVGAYKDIRHGLKSGWLLLAGVTIKVVYEQWFGAGNGIANLIEANVAIDAHLYGWLSGLLCILIQIFNKLKQTRS